MAELFDILSFAVDKRSALTMTDVYQEIANISIPNATLGTWEFGMSMISSFDQTTKSEYARFSTDGGLNWNEFVSEPKDKQNVTAQTYIFFKENVSGTLSIQVEARREDAVGIMTVDFIDVWLRRVT